LDYSITSHSLFTGALLFDGYIVRAEHGEKYYSFPYSLHFMMFHSVSHEMVKIVDL